MSKNKSQKTEGLKKSCLVISNLQVYILEINSEYLK